MNRNVSRPARWRGCTLLALLFVGACSYADWSLPNSDRTGPTAVGGEAELGGGSAQIGLPEESMPVAGLSGLSGGAARGESGAGGGMDEALAGMGGVAGAAAQASVAGAAGAEQASAGAGGALADLDCDPSAEFGAPVLVKFSRYRDRVDGRLSNDETTLYFASLGDIYVTTRANRNETFDDDQLVLHEPLLVHTTPSLTREGLSLYYGVLHVSNDSDPNVPAEGVYVSTRATTSDSFSERTLLSEFTFGAGSPFVTPSGRGLYYVRNDDIFQSAQSNGTFGQFFRLKALDSGGEYSFETLPLVSDDERTIYFASLRGGYDYDIWRATRNDRTGDFDPPSKVDALNSPTNEYPNWLSPDGCRIYLHRYADLNWDSPQLMVASRPARASR